MVIGNVLDTKRGHVFPTLTVSALERYFCLETGKELRSILKIATYVGRKKLTTINLAADAEFIILCQ